MSLYLAIPFAVLVTFTAIFLAHLLLYRGAWQPALHDASMLMAGAFFMMVPLSMIFLCLAVLAGLAGAFH